MISNKSFPRISFLIVVPIRVGLPITFAVELLVAGMPSLARDFQRQLDKLAGSFGQQQYNIIILL